MVVERKSDWSTVAARVKWAVKLARKRLSLTQEKLGKRIGVTRNTISKWENGKETKDPRKGLDELEGLMSIRQGWLEDGVDDPFADKRSSGAAAALPRPLSPREFKERTRALLDDLQYKLFSGPTLTGEEFTALEKEIEDWFGTVPNRPHGREDG